MNEEKALLTCTLREFLDAVTERFALMVGDYTEEQSKKRNLVYGLAGLSKLLGCSTATAARIKKSGVLAPAIHQTGKIIVVDADLALDLLKVKRGRNIIR